ncbi:protein D2 isoform X2 [Bemisia tabaci]|uniref:protein D2 isoform X2 n=1 Tax=Bemisia tabaci TaxID=7038 RepID=UPI003B27B4C7
MFRSLTSIIYLSLYTVTLTFTNRAPQRSTGDILDRLQEADIVDDIIQRAPYEPLEVHHGNWTVDFGNELPIQAFDMQPQVRWPAPNGTMYTLVVVGPDVPHRDKPEQRDWLHWLLGNIHNNDTTSGESRADYIGIERPLYQPGTHRIVYLLYKHQDNQEVFFFASVIKGREDFFDRSFFTCNLLSREHNFKNPLAVNFALVTVD